jgi:hypothetical protein
MNFKVMVRDVTPCSMIDWLLKDFISASSCHKNYCLLGCDTYIIRVEESILLEDGGHVFVQNVWNDLSSYVASDSRRHILIFTPIRTLNVIHMNFLVFGISYGSLKMHDFEMCRIP